MQTEIFIADVSPLNNPDVFQLLYNLVPQYRKDKVNRFRFQQGKNLSLGVGLLLSMALKQTDIDEGKLQIAYTDNGRPYYKGITGFDFSLSHSGTYAVCAVSESRIGADIETEREINLQLANRFFSQSDIDLIASSTDKDSTFKQIWTTKESYSKCKDIPFEKVLKQSVYPDCFFFTQTNADYCLTLCSESNKPPNIRHINLPDILGNF